MKNDALKKNIYKITGRSNTPDEHVRVLLNKQSGHSTQNRSKNEHVKVEKGDCATFQQEPVKDRQNSTSEDNTVSRRKREHIKIEEVDCATFKKRKG